MIIQDNPAISRLKELANGRPITYGPTYWSASIVEGATQVLRLRFDQEPLDAIYMHTLVISKLAGTAVLITNQYTELLFSLQGGADTFSTPFFYVWDGYFAELTSSFVGCSISAGYQKIYFRNPNDDI